MRADVILADPHEILADVATDARDLRAFERDGRKQIGIAGRMSIRDVTGEYPDSYLTWLVWHALTRQQIDVGDWDKFESRYVGLRNVRKDDDEDDELPDPTRPGRSGG